MAAILQMTDEVHLLVLKLLNLNKISLKYGPSSPIDNVAALVQEMTWCQTGDKPSSEPTFVYCTVESRYLARR